MTRHLLRFSKNKWCNVNEKVTNRAAHFLETHETPGSTRVCWQMIFSLFSSFQHTLQRHMSQDTQLTQPGVVTDCMRPEQMSSSSFHGLSDKHVAGSSRQERGSSATILRQLLSTPGPQLFSNFLSFPSSSPNWATCWIQTCLRMWHFQAILLFLFFFLHPELLNPNLGMLTASLQFKLPLWMDRPNQTARLYVYDSSSDSQCKNTTSGDES